MNWDEWKAGELFTYCRLIIIFFSPPIISFTHTHSISPSLNLEQRGCARCKMICRVWKRKILALVCEELVWVCVCWFCFCLFFCTEVAARYRLEIETGGATDMGENKHRLHQSSWNRRRCPPAFYPVCLLEGETGSKNGSRKCRENLTKKNHKQTKTNKV